MTISTRKIAEPPEDIPQSVVTKYGILEIWNEGNSKCKHEHVLYADNAFEGQSWWCDDCPRAESLNYSPGLKIPFPSNSYIRTQNPEFGEGLFYTHKANEEGISEGVLPKDEWVQLSIAPEEWLERGNYSYKGLRHDKFKKFK
jgi:hypothetical protein